MPARANRYNDPAIGAVFENIASMFAPPSAQDTAAYAAARGENQKADIIEKLKSDPRYAGADAGVLANLFDPTNSWAAQDQNTATVLSTNAADNARMVQTNALDNQVKLALPRFSPLDQGQVLPPVQGSLAAQFGLPTDLGAVAGPPKPLSETEARGAIITGAPPLTNDQTTALVMGSTPTQNVVDPVTGKPVVSYTPGAVGAEPFFNKGAEAKPELYSYTAPDGRRGTAVLTDKGLVDSQTQQPLPEGTRAAKANVQGTAEEVGLSPTTANETGANNQAAEVTRALGLLDLYEGVVNNDPSAIGLAGSIKGLAQNAIAVTQDLAASFGTSVPELQKFSGELRNGLSAVAPEMFDTAIPEAEFYVGALAYALARTENPSGEVSRQAYERAYDRVSGGALRNSQSARAAVGAFRKMLNTQLDGINALRDPDTARTDTSFQGETPATPTTDEAYAALPSGALFVDPEDGQTYRKP